MKDSGHGWQVPAALVAYLAAAVGWLLGPMWSRLSTHAVANPGTDIGNGLWGLDAMKHSLATGGFGIAFDHVNFPTGTLGFVLPWTSSLATSILTWPAGPITTWNLSLAFILLASAVGASWLARTWVGDWAAAPIAGIVLLAQPCIHHAFADGALEHTTFWSSALVLGLASAAVQRARVGRAALAGTSALLVALDSPYAAVGTAVVGAFVLPAQILASGEARGPRTRALAAFALTAGLCTLGTLVAYRYLADDPTDASTHLATQVRNAADFGSWGFGPIEPHGSQLSMPPLLAIACFLLALLDWKKAGPWALAAALLLLLASGPADAGGPSTAIGRALALVYDLPPLSSIRFPGYLLGPAGLSLGVAAACGLHRALGRLSWPPVPARPARLALVMLLGLGALQAGISSSGLHRSFPAFEARSVAFAEWLAAQPGSGAIMLVPIRGDHARGAQRHERATFAGLPASLGPYERPYLQLIHRRATVGFPKLVTLHRTRKPDPIRKLVKGWVALASNGEAAEEAASDAFQGPDALDQQREAFSSLVAASLEWLVLDEAALGAEGIRAVKEVAGSHWTEAYHFDEGTGVLVVRLE